MVLQSRHPSSTCGARSTAERAACAPFGRLNMRPAFTVIAASSALVAAIASASPAAASNPNYQVVNVGKYGGEPSIVSDHYGRLYDSTPSGGTRTFLSTNAGSSWSKVTT